MISAVAYYFCGNLSSGSSRNLIVVSTGMGRGEVLSWDDGVRATSPQVRFCPESSRFRSDAPSRPCFAGLGWAINGDDRRKEASCGENLTWPTQVGKCDDCNSE